MDVFDVIQELAECEFEIPFDKHAKFTGNRADLFEFEEEMWSGPKGNGDVNKPIDE